MMQISESVRKVIAEIPDNGELTIIIDWSENIDFDVVTDDKRAYVDACLAQAKTPFLNWVRSFLSFPSIDGNRAYVDVNDLEFVGCTIVTSTGKWWRRAIVDPTFLAAPGVMKENITIAMTG